ncbi:MAG: autotransporter domain-containing protein [Sphingomicrobium sp.]
MISTNRAIRCALAAATALTLFAGPASAQQIDRIVAFGDSFADTGNAVAILLANPLTPAPLKAQLQSAYPTGRFSGGTNYVDTLGQILQVPVVDFAVGGATTGPLNNAFPGLPSLTQEVAIFSSNLTPAGTIFPVANGFREGDLLALSIGGNDARGYYTANPAATPAQAAAAAAASVANATGNVNMLVAAGAPTISFLALDASAAPDLLANSTARALAASFSNSFNTGFQTTLAGYADNGVIVHYLDGATVLANVVANPAAYGIANIYCPPLAPATPQCLINSSGYLFYGDGVHLTSDGFKIIAQYVAAQLAAPLTLQAPSEASMNVGQQFGRTLTSRLDLGAPRDGDMPEGMHVYIVGDSYSRTIGSSRGNQSFDSDSVGVTGGLDYGFGSGVIGVAANYSKPKSNFETGAADVKSKAIQLGAYAGFGVGGAFAQGYVGYGWDDHDISRRGVVEGMSASTDGNHWIAGAKVGYLMNMGALRIGPVAALDYARVKVDGYTEDGDPALTLNVGATKYKSLRGSLGAELRGDFGGGGVQLRPYLALVAEKELGSGNRSVSFSQTSAPAIVNHFSFDDVSKKTYGRGTVGATARISSALTFDAGISMTAGKDQGNETSGHLGFRLGF